MSRRYRVSFIEYLNALPLGWGFLHGSLKDRFDILFDVPSECASHLQSGQADIGLIPVIEYQRIQGLRIVPDISIASKTEVKSVLFVSRRPLDRVSTIALDNTSRTSITLLKILLSKFYGLRSVSYFECSPQPERMLRSYDAALLIGNAALELSRDGLYVYDLAREWNHFTGLPFVFAFWATREGVDLGKDLSAFEVSRSEGLAAVDRIAEQYASRLSSPAQEIKEYLQSNLDYSLDSANRQGLECFFELARESGFIQEVFPLRFLSSQSGSNP